MAENWLGVSGKRASTAAQQASTPVNFANRKVFWNQPHPAGINGIIGATTIDFDEAAIFLETTNRGCGECHISSRVNEEGPCNHSEKCTITAVIGGGLHGGCWIEFQLRAGVTALDTHDFLEDVISSLGDGGVAGTVPSHMFICDNLTNHWSALISLLINNHGHHLVFGAPHNPWDGPIECFFDYLQLELSVETHKITCSNQLQQAINKIVQQSGGVHDRHFAHCVAVPRD